MVTYQNLITKSMYDKQLDSGKGTLLHLCDDVIQQEVCKPSLNKFILSCMCQQHILKLHLQVKEVIVSYYILMEQGKATIQVTISLVSALLSVTFVPHIVQSKFCLQYIRAQGTQLLYLFFYIVLWENLMLQTYRI